MALTERQIQEAQSLFAKGYTTADVFRHFGAQSIGEKSSIDFEESAIQNAETKPALKPIANKITDFLGLGGATQTFGDAIARTRLGAKLTGTDVEANRQFIEAPTGKELAGAALQTGAVVAGTALAPVSLPAQMIAGAGLGYAYDVGGDLMEGSSTQETLTPGVGTAIGTLAPPVLKGFGRFLKGPATTATADDLARMATGEQARVAAQAVPEQTVTQAIPEQVSRGTSAIKQTASDLLESGKRVGKRLSERTEEQALKAERIANASKPAVKQAIQSNLDEPLIDFATTADKPTRDAARKMVEIAEAPKKIGTNARPTQVAEETALNQYNLVLKDKKKVGEKIGELSKALPQAQNIDMLPAQRTMRDVLRQNGILPDKSGALNFQSQKYTAEEQATIQKLYDAATKRDVLSAKDIHETDQLFSKMQRNSRVIDKVDNVFVTTNLPDGSVKDVNIFKVFRDIYGKQLEKLSPEIKVANRQYRQYMNFLEDVEGKLVSNPEFSDLVSASADTDKFAEAGLRRIFGEGKGAAEREAIYNALDKVSRNLGYKGARADELYAFGEELRKLYPETIPKTGFRGQIGSSIMDKLSGIMEAGKVAPQDKQAALKALLEATE